VRSHLERIRNKTGARRRAELVRYAIQAGVAPATSSTCGWPPWPDGTSLQTLNGPFGPHLAVSPGPPGPCRRAPARRTLGLPLRLLDGIEKGEIK
jgi:hypothetical protein